MNEEIRFTFKSPDEIRDVLVALLLQPTYSENLVTRLANKLEWWNQARSVDGENN